MSEIFISKDTEWEDRAAKVEKKCRSIDRFYIICVSAVAISLLFSLIVGLLYVKKSNKNTINMTYYSTEDWNKGSMVIIDNIEGYELSTVNREDGETIIVTLEFTKKEDK